MFKRISFSAKDHFFFVSLVYEGPTNILAVKHDNVQPRLASIRNCQRPLSRNCRSPHLSPGDVPMFMCLYMFENVSTSNLLARFLFELVGVCVQQPPTGQPVCACYS